MTCNRPDADYIWRNRQSNEENRLVGEGDYFTTWCNRHLDSELSWRCTNKDQEDLKRYQYGISLRGAWDDINFEADGWWNGGCRSGSTGICKMKRPLEHNKYACCTNGKTGTLQCGKMWCKEDRSNCDTFMGAYCSSGTRLIDDANCYSKYQVSKADEISQFCAEPANLTKPSCRDFCTNQIAKDGDYSGTCQSAAGNYCTITENKTKTECACITYKNDPIYKELIAKYGDSLKTTNHQCWVPPCVSNDIWSNAMTSYTGTCPTTIQICAQNLNVSGLTAQNIGEIGSRCEQKASQGTIINVTPASAPRSSSPPSSSSAPRSSSSPPSPSPPPPGVSVSPSPSSSSPSPSPIGSISSESLIVLLMFMALIAVLVLKS